MHVEMKPVGRKRRFDREKDAKWRQVIIAFSSSGLSVRDFCRQNGIGEPSFYSWRRMLAQRDGQVESSLVAERPSSVGGQLSAVSNSQAALVPVTVVHGPVGGDAGPALKICVVGERGDEFCIHVDGRCPAALLDQVLSTLQKTSSAQVEQRC